MADFDAQQPVRALATEFTTEVANSTGTTINPAEDYAQGSTTSGQNGVLTQGATTTSAPTYTTGTTNPLSLDTSGNLRVTVSGSGTQSVIGGQTAESTAAWTSSTSANTTLAQTITGYNTVLVTLNQTSTITGGVVTFEVSDTVAFTNAYLVNATELNGFTTSTTYTLTANTNQAFLVNVAAAAAFRVRLSTAISGTGTVNVGIQANGFATEPSVVVGQGTSPWIDNLTEVGGSAITLGQKTSANSFPVVIASDQSRINTSDLADGTTGSTAPTTAILAGADVTSSTPTLTSGNLSSLYVTTSGRLIVDGSQVTQPVSGTVTANQGTSPWVDNISQWGGSATSLGQKTSANSVPVVIASDQSPINVQIGGVTPVVTYFTTASVASGSTTSFTVNGPISLDQVHATASGEIKVTIAIGPSGSETTYWQGFTSASNQNFDWYLKDPYTVPGGQDVLVTIKNRDTAAQDVYCSVVNH